VKKCNNYWTKDKCHEISLKYFTRGDFRKNDASAYRTSLSNKWLDDICTHMNYVNKYWDYSKCKIEALKYNNRTEFQKISKGAYSFSKRNNFLNKICEHMIKIGSKEFRCVYVFEFENNFAYVGLTYNIMNREFDHNRKGPVYKHIEKSKSKYKLIQLTDYIKKEEAQKIEENKISEYENNGWNLLNTMKNSTLGGSDFYWTYEKCKEEALKYKYRTDFRKKSGGAFSSAIRNDWYNEICSHMVFNKPENYWKMEELIFLIENHNKGFKYCSKELNRTYYSVKSRYNKLKMSNKI